MRNGLYITALVIRRKGLSFRFSLLLFFSTTLIIARSEVCLCYDAPGSSRSVDHTSPVFPEGDKSLLIHKISGVIAYPNPNNTPLQQITVFLKDGPEPVPPAVSPVPNVLQTTLTDCSGYFEFNAASGTYYLYASSVAPWGGLTTYDLVLINRHILGIELITDPLFLRAADANYNGAISTFDLVLFDRQLLGLCSPCYYGPDWLFDNPEVNLTTGDLQQNFRGVCTGDVNGSHSVPLLSLPNPVITGPPIACINSSGNSYSTQPGFLNYYWSVSPGGQITSGSGTNSILITWINAGQQSVSVTCTDANGCSPAAPTVKPVTVLSSGPSAAGYISGPSSVVRGQVNVAYSIVPIEGSTTYNWTLPPGACITSGANTHQIIVTFDTNATSGTMTVTGQNVCGTGMISPGTYITVVPGSYSTGNAVVSGRNCYHAVTHLTVAGSNTQFEVLAGGNAAFIAGEQINFLPGFRVFQGGYMYGRISVNGQFCDQVLWPVLNPGNTVTGTGQSACFQASQEIVTGGTGIDFMVLPGGTSHLIAGQVVRLQANTKAYPGSIFHAKISSDGTFCGAGGINAGISNRIIHAGEDECVDAIQSLSLGGLGGNVIVQPGGQMTLIAGQSILFSYGVWVESGGHLSGRITTTGEFCGTLKSGLDGDMKIAEIHDTIEVFPSDGSFFKIYPNPTLGQFTIRITEDQPSLQHHILCSNLVGHMVISMHFFGDSKHNISLDNQPPGIYFIKVISGGKAGVQKIILAK